MPRLKKQLKSLEKKSRELFFPLTNWKSLGSLTMPAFLATNIISVLKPRK